MEVRKIEIENSHYAKLIGENACVFNTIEWLRIYNNHIELYGVFGKNKNLVASFCLYKFKKLGTDFYINPLFCANNLFIYTSDAIHQVSINTFIKEVFEIIADYFASKRKSAYSFSFPYEYIDMQPFIWKKYEVQPKYTYLIDLSKDQSELMEGMSVERRGNVNSAIKKGLDCKISYDYSIAYELINKTLASQKIKIDSKILERVLFEFSNKSNSFSFITYQNSKPVAATFCIYDKHTCYYIAGGYDRENKSTGAGALAMWNSLLEAKKMQINTFDFEGSMVPAIEKYFRGFGGTIKPIFQVSKSSKVIKLGISFLDMIKG